MAARKYPWESWFDGEVHVLRRGQDFTIRTATFQHYLYEQARARFGVSIATRRLGDVVLMQAVG